MKIFYTVSASPLNMIILYFLVYLFQVTQVENVDAYEDDSGE